MAPSHGRPKDKGGIRRNSIVNEFESSNSTTAMFLGGVQKSWMTGQQPSAERPPRIATADQNQSSHIRCEMPEKESQFASISHGADNTVDCTPIHRQSPVQIRSPISSKDLGNQHQLDPAVSEVSVEAVLPSPAPSDEHRQDSTQARELEEDGLASIGPTKKTEVSRLSELAERYGGLEGLESRLRHTETIVAATASPALPVEQHFPAHAAQKRQHEHEVVGRKRIQTSSASDSRELASDHTSTSSDNRNNRPSGTTAHNNHRPTEAQMRSFGQKIAMRRQATMTEHHHRGQTEIARLSLLYDACVGNDHFYLLLHQLYCLYPTSTADNSNFQKLGFGEDQFQGFKMLSHLLLPNTERGNMRKITIDWFSKFPLPLNVLLRDFQVYRGALSKVQRCLAKLAHNWGPLRDLCNKRHFPPLTEEMTSSLGIESLTLQAVVFRAIYKDIWVGESNEPCFHEGEKLFNQSQQQMLQMSAHPSNLDTRTDNQSLIIRYQQLWAKHLAHSHSQMRNSTITPASAHGPTMPPPPNQVQTRVRTAPKNGADRPITNRLPQSNNLNVNTQLAQAVSSPNNTSTPTFLSTPTVPSQSFHSLENGAQSPIPSTAMIPSHVFLGSAPPASTPLISPQLQIMQSIRSPSTPHIPFNAMTDNMSGGFNEHQQQRRASSSTSNSLMTSYPTPPNQNYTLNSWQAAAQRQGVQMHPIQAQSSGGRSNSYDTTIPYSITVPSPQARTYQPLLPPPGHTIPSTALVVPTVTALHQAHVRSPVLTVVDPNNSPRSGLRYFRYTKGITILRSRLKIDERQYVRWSFNVEPDNYAELVGTVEGQRGEPPSRTVRVGSRFCRIRCVDATRFDETIDESDWVVSNNIWPCNVAIILNDMPLEVRRKAQHGKDLPINITAIVREGWNTLSVSILRPQHDDRTTYAIGVETIQLADTPTIKAGIGTLGYVEAQRQIMQRFQSDDPDVQAVNPSITLDITDPYSARIFEIPVRGNKCQHSQCFDLDNFLLTRGGSAPDQPCMPDSFRCPICGGDARPQSLVKDEFFIALRNTLAAKDRLDAKAIVMEEDGTWQIKEEEQTGESGDGGARRSKTREQSAAASAERGFVRRETEVIEID